MLLNPLRQCFCRFFLCNSARDVYKRQGYAFSEDTDLQRDFELRFAYDETDDQLRCTEEIKRDMERSVHMERLLCGDVGFGKTEVALRAAFMCISEGKQCALLVPTKMCIRDSPSAAPFLPHSGQSHPQQLTAYASVTQGLRFFHFRRP